MLLADVEGCSSGSGEDEASEGEAIEEGKMKSSRFIESDKGALDWSTDCRSCAMPEGALVFMLWRDSLVGDLSVRMIILQARSSVEPAVDELRRTNSFACSRSLRFRLMAIIRQVRFSMRSWFGSCVFVLL